MGGCGSQIQNPKQKTKDKTKLVKKHMEPKVKAQDPKANEIDKKPDMEPMNQSQRVPSINSENITLNLSVVSPVIFRKGQFTKEYSILEPLKKGSMGDVYKVQHNQTRQYRALKYIKKTSKNIQKQNEVRNEANSLKALDHPHVIKLYEFIEDEASYYVIEELCEGGQLIDRILSTKNFTEQKASLVMYQLLSALNYIHSQKIVHGDVQPENIMYENFTPESHIKLIDFSVAKEKSSIEQFNHEGNEGTAKFYDGTVEYQSPEMFRGQKTEKCDIWAAGILMCFLLTGHHPFQGENIAKTRKNIMRGALNLAGQEWNQVSKEAQTLVTKLLTFSESKRPSASQVLKDPWLQKFRNKPSKEVLKQTLQGIQSYKTSQQIQSAILMFAINSHEMNQEKAKLMETFQALDTDEDGHLSYEEMLKGYQNFMSHEEARKQVDQIFKSMDQDKSGQLDYSEFIMATIDRKKLLTKENLTKTFKMLDKDKSGTLTWKEIKKILGGKNLQEDEIEGLLAEVDENSDGRLSLKEFIDIMGRF